MFDSLDRNLATCSKISIAAGGLILLLIALIGAGDTVSTSLFNHPFPVANRLSEQLLPAAVLLSVGYVLRIKANIVVDILSNVLGHTLRALVGLLSAMALVVFFAGLTIGAWELALESVELMETATAAIEFPVWPMKLCYAFGCTVALLESFSILLTSIPGLSLTQYQYPEKN